MEVFQDTIATQKIFSLKKRIRAVSGGTSASKTISILVWCIDYAQVTKNKKIDIMAESYPHLEDGAIKDFKQIMLAQGYWEDARWNDTKHIYTFGGKSVIKFISVDKLGKAKGPRRDVLFVNEANHAMTYQVFDQLRVRTKEVIWLDWNPSNEFWYYDEIDGKVDHDFLRLTYLDCLDALDQNIVDDIESHKHNKQWWLVYGLGYLGEVEGKIFKGWKEIDEIPHGARLERYGLDFGYTNDPSVIIALYYHDGGYIVDEIVWKKGMSAKQMADRLLDEEPALVVADSAEPRTIQEIKDYGINITGVVKKKRKEASGPAKNFVSWSIELIQNNKFSITKRSLRVLKDYRNYLWDTDKDGNIINVPHHDFSDSMDAVRYAGVSLIKQPNFKKMEASPLLDNYYPELGI